MTARLKQCLFAAFVGFGLLLALPIDAGAQGAGAVVPLPAEMRNAAASYLPGVVGEAVPAFPIRFGPGAAGCGHAQLRDCERR